MRKAAAPAAPPDATALLSSLRGVAAQLIAAKQAGGETSQLASDGSALLMEMRRQEHAVLEAMEERQVTVAGRTHAMPPLFMVMATQNPIEQEGTYPLPEAQMDRFLMHVRVDYPPIS